MSKFENVLFVGIGGGNDLFSTLLARWSLKRIGWQWKSCALAGVLSPFHRYTADVAPIPGVSTITPETKRFALRKDREFEVGCIDAQIANMFHSTGYADDHKPLGLSLENGTEGLSQAFRELAKKFDYIVLVDVGGDCFYRGKGDWHVLSPMFDAMVIRAFVDAKVPGILFEAGPGTDGELEPEALESVLEQVEAKAFPLEPDVVDAWRNFYVTWIEPIRSGNTVPVTIEAYYSPREILTREYRVRAHRGRSRMYHCFEQQIKTALCRQFYLVDPARINNPFAVRCSNPHEWFVLTQVRQHRTSCELNLECFRYQGSIENFLTPSPLFPREDQLTQLRLGVRDLLDGGFNWAWMFGGDWEAIQAEFRSNVLVVGSNDLVSIGRL